MKFCQNIFLSKHATRKPNIFSSWMNWDIINSNAVSLWAGWALAHPDFGSSVNPIPTKGADYAHHNTACPP